MSWLRNGVGATSSGGTASVTVTVPVGTVSTDWVILNLPDNNGFINWGVTGTWTKNGAAWSDAPVDFFAPSAGVAANNMATRTFKATGVVAGDTLSFTPNGAGANVRISHWYHDTEPIALSMVETRLGATQATIGTKPASRSTPQERCAISPPGKTAAAATIVAAWPGAVVGDTAVVFPAWTFNTTTLTTPTGWTKVVQSAGSTGNQLAMFTKVLTSTDIANGSQTFTFSTTVKAAITGVVYQGAVTFGTPSTGNSTSSSTVVTGRTVTTTSDWSEVLCVYTGTNATSGAAGPIITNGQVVATDSCAVSGSTGNIRVSVIPTSAPTSGVLAGTTNGAGAQANTTFATAASTQQSLAVEVKQAPPPLGVVGTVWAVSVTRVTTAGTTGSMSNSNGRSYTNRLTEYLTSANPNSNTLVNEYYEPNTVTGTDTTTDTNTSANGIAFTYVEVAGPATSTTPRFAGIPVSSKRANGYASSISLGTLAVGDVIVVHTLSEDQSPASSPGIPACTEGGVTQTDLAKTPFTSLTYNQISVLVVTTAGAKTITNTDPTAAGTLMWNVKVTVFPAAGGFSCPSPSLLRANNTGASSLSWTPAKAGNYLSWNIGDWSATDGVSRVIRSPGIEVDYASIPTVNATMYWGYNQAPSTSTQTVGYSTPSGQKYEAQGVEITYTSSTTPGPAAPNFWPFL